MTNQLRFFVDLGSLVENRWRSANYNEDAFPDIAAQALLESEPCNNVDPWDIIRWCHATPQLPSQQDLEGKFGDPPLTVFAGPRFHVDAYFWVDGTTTIHQHGFAGAFQVLLGSSIHCGYRFDNERKISAHFSVGNVVFESVECLRMGDVRRILPGKKSIHSLFHLDRPSVSIAIRTYGSPSAQPQYDYWKPYFAIDPFFHEPTMMKRLQTAQLLLAVKHPDAEDLIGDLIASADFHTSYSLLSLIGRQSADAVEKAFQIDTGRQRYERLLDRARTRHGNLVDLITPVLEEIDRQRSLVERRSYLTGHDQRFFLALLLNVPDRAGILELVRQRFPGEDAVDIVVGWVEELSTTRLFGSTAPSVLGINTLDDTALLVLRCLLKDLDIEQTKQAVRDEYADEAGHDLDHDVDEVIRTFQESVLLKSLLI